MIKLSFLYRALILLGLCFSYQTDFSPEYFQDIISQNTEDHYTLGDGQITQSQVSTKRPRTQNHFLFVRSANAQTIAPSFEEINFLYSHSSLNVHSIVLNARDPPVA